MLSHRRYSFRPITPARSKEAAAAIKDRYLAVLRDSSPQCALNKMKGVLQGGNQPAARAPVRVEPRPKTIKDLVFLYKSRTATPSAEDFCDRFLPEYFSQGDPHLVEEVRERTCEQGLSKIWYDQRNNRITASNFHAVKKRQQRIEKGDEVDNTCLVKKLTSVARRPATVNSLRWGIDHESDALQAYKELEAIKHVNMTVTQTGLHIIPDVPYLAASPDALVECDCCGKGVLEIKCPYTLRDKDVNRHPPAYVTPTGLIVDEQKGYYDQITGEMAATGRTWCHFFVWTDIRLPDDPRPVDEDEERGYPLMRTIKFNEEYWEDSLMPRLMSYYRDVVAPVVVMGAELQQPAKKGKQSKKTTRKASPVETAHERAADESDEPVHQSDSAMPDPPAQVSADDDAATLPALCVVCSTPCKDEPAGYDENSIECDSCHEWTHFPCANIARRGRRPQQYLCGKCRASK